MTYRRDDPTAIDVEVSDTLLRVTLADRREVAAPLAWFPRLRDASPEQRGHRRFIGRGTGVRCPDVDEDISVRGLPGLPTWVKTANGGPVKWPAHRRGARPVTAC